MTIGSFICRGSFILLIILAFIACEIVPCSDSDGVQLNAGFYASNGLSVSDTSIKILRPYALIQSDTVFLEDMLSSDYQMVFLPFSKTSDTSCFVFSFDSLGCDTLMFIYTKTLKLESHECGFDFFYNLTGASTTTHVIDSVWIRKANVEYGEEENLKIFF